MQVSRLAFLGLPAAAAVGATRHPEEPLDADPQQCGDLPPSLPALYSRRAEARPISSDERAGPASPGPSASWTSAASPPCSSPAAPRSSTSPRSAGD